MNERLNRISIELSEFVAASSCVIATQPIALENEMVFIPPDQRRDWEVAHVTDTSIYWRAVTRGRLPAPETQDGKIPQDDLQKE